MEQTDQSPAGGPVADAVGSDEPGEQVLAERLGHRFTDPKLLRQALAHRSWCGEREDEPSNERLEFLGDAVLGLVVADYSYRRFPDLPEGKLAKIRAAVVNARALAELSRPLGVGSAIRLGRGEESSGGRTKASILSDTFEALIGAVYVDAGWEPAQALILRLLTDRIDRAALEPDDFDHKSRLQELTVRLGEGTPRYSVEGSGPDHDRHYEARVFVAGTERGHGVGRSKKDAEQAAAGIAWAALRGLEAGDA